MSNLMWAVAAILVILWILGLSLNFTLGGFIHLLLALAVVAVFARVIMGRSFS